MINHICHGWSHLPSLVLPSHDFPPFWANAIGHERCVYVFLTSYSLFRFPHTCLLCQQHNRPLPSNKGCRLPFNIIEGSLASAEGYGNGRGDPGCGILVRYVRRCDHNYLHTPTLRCDADYPSHPLPLNPDKAQQQHPKPTTCSQAQC